MSEKKAIKEAKLIDLDTAIKIATRTIENKYSTPMAVATASESLKRLEQERDKLLQLSLDDMGESDIEDAFAEIGLADEEKAA